METELRERQKITSNQGKTKALKGGNKIRENIKLQLDWTKLNWDIFLSSSSRGRPYHHCGKKSHATIYGHKSCYIGQMKCSKSTHPRLQKSRIIYQLHQVGRVCFEFENNGIVFFLQVGNGVCKGKNSFKEVTEIFDVVVANKYCIHIKRIHILNT